MIPFSCSENRAHKPYICNGISQLCNILCHFKTAWQNNVDTYILFLHRRQKKHAMIVFHSFTTICFHYATSTSFQNHMKEHHATFSSYNTDKIPCHALLNHILFLAKQKLPVFFDEQFHNLSSKKTWWTSLFSGISIPYDSDKTELIKLSALGLLKNDIAWWKKHSILLSNPL